MNRIVISSRCKEKKYPDRKGFKAPEQITRGNLSTWFLWRCLKGKKPIFS